MSTKPATLISTWQVGGYVCSLSLPVPKPGAVLQLAVEWSPSVPKRLTPDELEAYQAGRNRALAELAALLGGPAVVLEC